MAFETEQSLIDRGVLEGASPALTQGSPWVPPRLLVQWNLTEQCNLRCSHCYQEQAAGAGAGPELTWDQARLVLDRLTSLYHRWGIGGHLNLSGGEPLVSPWFWNLVEALASRGPQIGFSVLTNGTLLTAGDARRLKALGCSFVQVSLDGDREVHDRVRGPGSFDRTVRSLGLLRRAGLSSMVSFTVGATNAASFPAVARLCRRMGVRVLWSDRVLPLGAGAQEALMTPAEVEGFFHSMAASLPRGPARWFNPTTIRMHRALQFLTGCDLGFSARPYACTAGRTLVSILPDGSLVPCRRLPVVVGHALEDDLEEVFQTSPLLVRLRDSLPDECAPCPHAAGCRGGLRCLAHACHGTPFRADPQCFYRDRITKESHHGSPGPEHRRTAPAAGHQEGPGAVLPPIGHPLRG